MTGSSESKDAPPLRAVQDSNPFSALGRAVSYMMTMPSFAELKFGHWSKTLTGQINRKHYLLVMEGDKTVGFLGWAYVNEKRAKAWAEGKSEITSAESHDGDCVVVNVWASDNVRVHRVLVKELRRVGHMKKCVYGKRFYKDGRVRPVILNVNEFVESHMSKTEAQ